MLEEVNCIDVPINFLSLFQSYVNTELVRVVYSLKIRACLEIILKGTKNKNAQKVILTTYHASRTQLPSQFHIPQSQPYTSISTVTLLERHPVPRQRIQP
jgi:hypothetical protein